MGDFNLALIPLPPPPPLQSDLSELNAAGFILFAGTHSNFQRVRWPLRKDLFASRKQRFEAMSVLSSTLEFISY